MLYIYTVPDHDESSLLLFVLVITIVPLTVIIILLVCAYLKKGKKGSYSCTNVGETDISRDTDDDVEQTGAE